MSSNPQTPSHGVLLDTLADLQRDYTIQLQRLPSTLQDVSNFFTNLARSMETMSTKTRKEALDHKTKHDEELTDDEKAKSKLDEKKLQIVIDKHLKGMMKVRQLDVALASVLQLLDTGVEPGDLRRMDGADDTAGQDEFTDAFAANLAGIVVRRATEILVKNQIRTVEGMETCTCGTKKRMEEVEAETDAELEEKHRLMEMREAQDRQDEGEAQAEARPVSRESIESFLSGFEDEHGNLRMLPSP